MSAILIVILGSFILMLIMLTYAESAANKRKLPTISSHYTLNKWEHDYSSIIKPSDTSIIIDGKQVNITNHHLYILTSSFPDVYDMPKKGNILCVKHKEDIENISEMLPKTGIYKYPKKDKRMTPYVACKVWLTDSLPQWNSDLHIFKNTLMQYAYEVVNHPKYQLYRSMSTYLSDDYVYKCFEKEIDQYLKYLEKNHYNKNDLKFYIITYMYDTTDDWVLHIIPDTKFVGIAEYYAAKK